ncbi:hypothetical protein G6F24_016838 [Rhizopus arrhizus]|nr:hypothetical protein G6F24_016838 [Rhizopus arrhizus]
MDRRGVVQAVPGDQVGRSDVVDAGQRIDGVTLSHDHGLPRLGHRGLWRGHAPAAAAATGADHSRGATGGQGLMRTSTSIQAKRSAPPPTPRTACG